MLSIACRIWASLTKDLVELKPGESGPSLHPQPPLQPCVCPSLMPSQPPLFQVLSQDPCTCCASCHSVPPLSLQVSLLPRYSMHMLLMRTEPHIFTSGKLSLISQTRLSCLFYAPKTLYSMKALSIVYKYIFEYLILTYWIFFFFF